MAQAVWITRTQPGAQETAQAVQAMGYRPLIAPLLTVSRPRQLPPALGHGDVLIFTSKNAVQAFCDFFPDRGFDVVTVGEGTAKAARRAGFTNILSAEGRADDIAPLIIREFGPDRLCVHAAGVHVRGRIIEDLQLAGYQARRDLYYQSAPVKQMPDLGREPIAAVLVFSPLGAQTLVRQMQAVTTADMSQSYMISISPATDAALGNINCAGRTSARRPTQASLLQALRTVVQP